MLNQNLTGKRHSSTPMERCCSRSTWKCWTIQHVSVPLWKNAIWEVTRPLSGMFCFALFFHSCTSLHDLMQRWNILVVFLVYVCEDCPTPFGQMLLDGDKRVLRFLCWGDILYGCVQYGHTNWSIWAVIQTTSYFSEWNPPHTSCSLANVLCVFFFLRFGS